MTTYQTCESVLAGHPDKTCDFIADSILDACLAHDKSSRVACEVMATKGHIIVAGEITCAQRIDVKFIVRRALSFLGYKPWKYRVSVHLHQQSADIQAGVDKAIEAREMDRALSAGALSAGAPFAGAPSAGAPSAGAPSAAQHGNARPQPTDLYDQTGAGDQGTVYGYATSENREMLPMPLVLAHRICRRLDVCRRKGVIAGLGADGKAQVTVAYRDGKPMRVKTVVISVQHDKKMTREELERDVRMCVLPYAFHAFPLDKGTEILVNPSGRFVIGGPDADTGLTGRKLMVDTYGGVASQGGGALCGKDPTKVDRSGAYMARYVAKNLVWAGLAEKAEVGISYAIGKARPVMVTVRGFGTSALDDETLTRIVTDVFDMRPRAMIDHLGLRDVTYRNTSSYGHFGHRLFPWERTDQLEALRNAARRMIEGGTTTDDTAALTDSPTPTDNSSTPTDNSSTPTDDTAAPTDDTAALTDDTGGTTP